MTRGQLIFAERKRRGLSQQDMAAAAKISQQSYSDIEKDIIKSPRRPILKAIGKMLDIPFESLLLGDDWRNEPPMLEKHRVMARELPYLSPEAESKVLVVILEDKQRRQEEAEKEAEQVD